MWWTAALRAAQKMGKTLWLYFDRGRQAAFHIFTLNSKL